jgi:hypothetical protein
MNNKSLTIGVIAAVAVMLIATSAVATEDAFAGNGVLPLNVGCQNIGSQVQGDENAVSQAAEQFFP